MFMFIFIIAFVIAVASLPVIGHYYERLMKCGDCKKWLLANVIDCSPTGKNPLNIHPKMVRYHCKNKECGKVYEAIDAN